MQRANGALGKPLELEAARNRPGARLSAPAQAGVDYIEKGPVTPA
jgi:hypothetical protein